MKSLIPIGLAGQRKRQIITLPKFLFVVIGIGDSGVGRLNKKIDIAIKKASNVSKKLTEIDERFKVIEIILDEINNNDIIDDDGAHRLPQALRDIKQYNYEKCITIIVFLYAFKYGM